VTDHLASAQSTRPEIEYWQGRLQLVAFDGRDVVRSLPRDEVTAAVVLGAMLARNRDDGTWPGEYRAVVRIGDTAVVVAEDDLRVAVARTVLCGLFPVDRGQLVRRDFSEEELEATRRAVIAAGQPEPEPGAAAGLKAERA
jgi:hypothetical protein